VKSDRNRGRDEWPRDVDARQRNAVFPDTASNESRFWRNIIHGKQKLSTAQIVGITLMYLTLAAALYGLISAQLSVADVQGTLWQRVIAGFGGQIIPLTLVGGFLVAIKLWSYRNDSRRKFGKNNRTEKHPRS
jgi:hypothetical protein